MRRFLCMAMTGVMVLGFLCISAGAVEEVNPISGKYETAEIDTTRATGTLNYTIRANGSISVSPAFSLAAGETVRIRANYSPEDASLDFGLVDLEGVFHYINVTTGSIDKTIEIPENGSYTLMIRNNSSKSVVVTGTVRY